MMNEQNPYAAPEATIAAVPAEDSLEDFVLAGRGARFLAQILNFLIMVVAFIPGGIVMGGSLVVFLRQQAGGAGPGTGTGGAAPAAAATAVAIGGLVMLLGLIVVVVINLVMLHKSSQSIGKKVVGVKIVRSNGDHAGLMRLVGYRYIVMVVLGTMANLIIVNLSMLLSLVDSLMIFGGKKQCLHDRFADTIVVKV